MIFCKECGYNEAYVGRICPLCGAEISFSAEELSELEQARRDAVARGDRSAALEYAHILADAGNPAAAAAYGRMLYEAGGESRSSASSYLAIAAEGGDAVGAYTYGRLLSERGEEKAQFFLLYAALLGYAEAYAPAAEIFFEMGREAEGVAYLTLAAAGGDCSAALSLARRYEKGLGTARNAGLAKWYLSLVRPLPVHAWPLALRLCRTAAERPQKAPSAPNVTALIAEMLAEAEKRGYKKIYLSLCQMLATGGSTDAQCRLGALYAEGFLGKKEPEKAKEVLLHYGKKGNAAAYLMLGDMYCKGDGLAASRADAATCYQAAKALGSAEACVRLGDLYAEGTAAPNIAYAYSLYKEALALGSAKGAKAAREIEQRREALYAEGMQALSNDAEDAYRNFALSASMGYKPAAVALGLCYEEGIGIEKDRRRAFLWYENAARQDPIAEYRLGRCYFLGIGVNRDFRKAHDILRHSASLGVEEARQELFAMLEARKKKEVRSLYSLGVRLFYLGKHEAAKAMLERASSLGIARATYLLGCFYEFGIGTAVDRDRAYATYRAAELSGFKDPRASVKSIVLKMMYGSQSREKGEALKASPL